ncbi:class I SAM-dependent RNA methyltransferase [Novosphingopyxis sp.]|uniref:class I SAM-dependent RNA methyltransferase n=1 Tax=Novosphingopyxis sp. TaxID=2709690 RepID=UPI003B59A6F2
MSDSGGIVLRVAAHGDGLTEDGRHVALTAPGDHVAADGSITPGPHHAQPVCRHFPECGGCQLQHLDDTALSDFVRDRVLNALVSQNITADEVAPVHLSPPRSRRRAVLHAINGPKGPRIGFTKERSHHVVDMMQCEVIDPRLFEMVAPLRRLLANRLPKGGGAEIILAIADQGVDVAIKGARFDGMGGHDAIIDFAEAHRLARICVDEGHGPEPRWEPRPVTISFGTIAVPLPPGAFLQATQDGEAVLLLGVKRAVGDAATVADLFAGLGTFALSMNAGTRVYAAEADRAAIESLKAGADAARLHAIAEHRDLFRRPLETSELDRFDAVILDPPRAGAREQTIRLADAKTPRIAYVSCNPASFAKDAGRLIEGGYRLKRVTPVGQFRWSTHVELVGAFER